MHAKVPADRAERQLVREAMRGAVDRRLSPCSQIAQAGFKNGLMSYGIQEPIRSGTLVDVANFRGSVRAEGNHVGSSVAPRPSGGQ